MFKMILGLVAAPAVFASAVLAQQLETAPPPSAPTWGAFEFVGYSSITSGNVRIQDIYEACQNDFGPQARICTFTEFLFSPNAEAPALPSDAAWVRQVNLPTSFHNCSQWTYLSGGGRVIINVLDFSGRTATGTRACNDPLPVTCCARRP
jgi:hypothetical protein